jgi:hypothetical protein
MEWTSRTCSAFGPACGGWGDFNAIAARGRLPHLVKSGSLCASDDPSKVIETLKEVALDLRQDGQRSTIDWDSLCVGFLRMEYFDNYRLRTWSHT